MKRRIEAKPLSTPETCERCGARIVRNPDQPRLCGACAPPSEAHRAITRALSALLAQRAQLAKEAA